MTDVFKFAALGSLILLPVTAGSTLAQAVPSAGNVARQTTDISRAQAPAAQLRDDTGPGHALDLPDLPKLNRIIDPSGFTEVTYNLTAIHLVGAGLLPASTTDPLIAPYLNRAVTPSEIIALRDQLTLMVVRQGYVNSGAVITDPDGSDGMVEITLVAGAFEMTHITGLKGLSPAYITHRLHVRDGATVNVNALKVNYQQLLEDRNIASINASLLPGSRPGLAVLNLDIRERKPTLSLFSQSDRSPAVGAVRTGLNGAFHSLARPGDQLDGELGRTKGLYDARLAYETPITGNDTSLNVFASGSTGRIIEQPYNALDLVSKSLVYGGGLTVPLYHNVGRALRLNTSIDHVWVKTTLFGSTTLGRATDYSTARSSLTYSYFSNQRAYVVAATVAHGLTGPRQNGIDAPDPHFWSIGLSGQYVAQTSRSGQKIILRGQAQFARRSLYPTESLALGGAGTVRGYRQNATLGDRGEVVSAEYQWPLTDLHVPAGKGSGAWRDRIAVSIFADAGQIANVQAAVKPSFAKLASVGARAQWQVTNHVVIEGYYARPLNKSPAHTSFEDNGLGFNLRYDF